MSAEESDFFTQSPLERHLRAHLWHPQDRLARAEKQLPAAIRKKKWATAARLEEVTREATAEIAIFERLLELHQEESEWQQIDTCDTEPMLNHGSAPIEISDCVYGFDPAFCCAPVSMYWDGVWRDAKHGQQLHPTHWRAIDLRVHVSTKGVTE